MGSVAGLGVTGLLLLVCILSVAFWVVRRRRFDEAIRNSLGDRDPAVRLATIEVLERQGAEHHVASLLWRSRVELDPSVRERLDRLVIKPMPSLAFGGHRSRSIRARRAGFGPGWVRCAP
jgi:hypothetical protein